MQIDVDYENHPAFSQFVEVNARHDAFEGAFAELDAAIASVVRGSDNAQLSEVVERWSGRIRDDQPVHALFRPHVVDAFRRAVDRSIDEETRRLRWGVALDNASPMARKRAQEVLEQGYYMFKMPKATLARLQQVLMPDIDSLRKRAADAPDDIIVAPPSNHEAIWILEDFCRSSGLAETLGAYYGEEYGQLGFVIHLSSPGDTWHRVFDDIDLEMPKTTQMHFDLAYEVPKAMLYLNDVGQAQGPFSIVSKSDPWERFGTQLAFRKEVLYGLNQFVGDHYKKATRGNTSILRHVEARQTLASLPKQLRGTSHPGDHILDGTSLSDKLLAAEQKLVGEAGSMPLFLGSHVLHRGGIVEQGERLALQIVFPQGAVPSRPSTSLISPEQPEGLLDRVSKRFREILAR